MRRLSKGLSLDDLTSRAPGYLTLVAWPTGDIASGVHPQDRRRAEIALKEILKRQHPDYNEEELTVHYHNILNIKLKMNGERGLWG